jgi:hypothetical protein
MGGKVQILNLSLKNSIPLWKEYRPLQDRGVKRWQNLKVKRARKALFFCEIKSRPAQIL